MLVPLETLPGWPPVQNPSALEALGLLVGLPVLVFAIVFGIAKIGNMAKAARSGSDGATDSVWVGGPTRPEIEGPRHDEAAIEAGDGLIEHEDAETGGAGARW
ncbi:MAG TPA: hypothetical protein VIT20_08375 [Propionibacteriaceae bacterium]